MARVTVEDCEQVVKNRFDLVILAAQRTRQILAGDAVTIKNDDEKKPVISLREIAAGTVSLDALKESSIRSFRSFAIKDDLEDESYDMTEEDSYNPYIGIEVKSLESDKIHVVKDSEVEETAPPQGEFGEASV
ncbi:MAG: DNA-directed RNA polymerase subunit omega [Holosporaceae bacterium]|jgi:DNA-directed RNA polymerase subunit omega|nr:DNA-directed RNA polymerase subunit omega [Holosporaceae bacterium]